MASARNAIAREGLDEEFASVAAAMCYRVAASFLAVQQARAGFENAPESAPCCVRDVRVQVLPEADQVSGRAYDGVPHLQSVWARVARWRVSGAR